MAFVLVQHLAPDHKSMLAALLGKMTAMPVTEAEDGMSVVANSVYVIPPDATLTYKEGLLRVSRPAPPRERRRPIDTFFSSLAEDQGENAVCIVLSGTGSDGTLGLKAIKEHGGLVLAQADLDHTAMSGMPHSAAATGLVDELMPVQDMPAKLLDYLHHLESVAPHKDGDGTRRDTAEHLAKIHALLRVKVGHDFSKYKEKTLVRRIQRRMQVLQIDTVSAYIDRLREDPHQVEILFRELLISVTQFFRDPNAFTALERMVTKLLENTSADDQVRIWVPGCSTGEEVYSVAILLSEAMERSQRAPRVQIFGTDIDADAVALARHGRYRRTAGLSSERLKRWFVEQDDEFCPIRSVRDMCVFSIHSVVKDPPFSKLDLISCRNLLIYMDADLQDRVLRTFHYALTPSGILFLGPSEGVTRVARLYTTVDKKHRIYQRSDSNAVLPELTPVATPPQTSWIAPTIPRDEDRVDRNARHVLAKYSPAYVVVDKQHQILRFSGSEVGRYLEPSSGAATLNLFGLLRKGLRQVVRSALQTVQATSEPIVHDNVPIKINGRSRFVTVIVEPIAEGATELCVVAFQEARPGTNGDRAKLDINGPDTANEALKHELRATKVQLKATIDELETTNEEMKSTAEEFQSVNEELQASNEELETSKEEMQSINEELQTINAELISKNETLTRVNSDLKNLLDSTEIATIFLDQDLRIKSFTPGMTDIFPVRDSDRGRPITDIVTQLTYPGLQAPQLQADVQTVLRKLSMTEREVQLADKGLTFIMRIRPYRTVENVIDGVVVTFVDISDRKKADAAILASEQRFSAIVREATVGVAEFDVGGRIILANETYCALAGRSFDQLRTLRIQDAMHPDDWQQNAEQFARLFAEGEAFRFDGRFFRPDGTAVWTHSNLSALKDRQGRIRNILSINLDVDARKRAEADAALLLAELDHRVKNILAIITAVIGQTLKSSSSPGDFASNIEGRIAAIARAHSLAIQKGRHGEASLRDLITTELAPFGRQGRKLVIEGEDVILTSRAALALGLAIHELASNAAKYGGLSTFAGNLAVVWKCTGEGPGRKLQLTWTEAGGPAVNPPTQRGFGSKLIERNLILEFDAKVNPEFNESGLRCTIEIPLTSEVGHIRTRGSDGRREERDDA
jgi:two-component system, chemotaxis family, CheB/CheR fusion protein